MAASNQHQQKDKTVDIHAVWLDAHVYDNEDNKKAQKQLSKNFGRCRLFTSTKECQQVIDQCLGDTTFVLIVSGQLGSEFVPKIHENPRYSSIYVYCQNIEAHKKWAYGYSKVRCFLILYVLIIVLFI
jgi:hypothetical protein